MPPAFRRWTATGETSVLPRTPPGRAEASALPLATPIRETAFGGPPAPVGEEKPRHLSAASTECGDTFGLRSGMLHQRGVRWCIRDSGVFPVPATKQNVASKSKRDSAPRASVTFPPELYEMLEAIARSKKVSVAWVVRDAAERYVAEQWPLLGRPQ